MRWLAFGATGTCRSFKRKHIQKTGRSLGSAKEGVCKMTDSTSTVANSAEDQTADTKSPKRAKLDRYLARKVDWLNEMGLLDRTQMFIIKNGSNECQLAETLGFSPLVNPKDGRRYGDDRFRPFWTSLRESHGWYEMTVEIGEVSGFTFVIFFDDNETLHPAVREMCRKYAEPVFN